MDLIDVAAAPSPWTAGGVPHLAGRLTLRGLAVLRAFAAEAVPGAAWGSPEVTQALLGGAGLPLLAWCSLYRTEGMTLAQAQAIAGRLTEAEASRLVAILFRRRPGADDAGAEGQADPDDDAGREVDWGRLVDRLSESRHLSYDQVLDLSLDQIVNACHDGDPPEPGERPLTHEEVVELTTRAREEAKAGGTYRDPPGEEDRRVMLERIDRQRQEAKRRQAGGDDNG